MRVHLREACLLFASAITKSYDKPHAHQLSLTPYGNHFLVIMMMNKSQETMVFSGRLKLTSAMKPRPTK